jgi:hypothetical protein
LAQGVLVVEMVFFELGTQYQDEHHALGEGELEEFLFERKHLLAVELFPLLEHSEVVVEVPLFSKHPFGLSYALQLSKIEQILYYPPIDHL